MFLQEISLSKTMCLLFDFATSSFWTLRAGVPQRSVLGLLLFLVFTHFLDDLVPSHGFKFTDSYLSAVFLSQTLEYYIPSIQLHLMIIQSFYGLRPKLLTHALFISFSHTSRKIHQQILLADPIGSSCVSSIQTLSLPSLLLPWSKPLSFIPWVL